MENTSSEKMTKIHTRNGKRAKGIVYENYYIDEKETRFNYNK